MSQQTNQQEQMRQRTAEQTICIETWFIANVNFTDTEVVATQLLQILMFNNPGRGSSQGFLVYMSKKQKEEWETNRDFGRRPKHARFWCWKCDHCLVGLWEKCKYCGYRNGEKRNKK